MSSFFAFLETSLDSVQVELQGQYSIQRLRELRRHLQTARLRADLVILLLIPVPCIALVVLADIPKLQPIEQGQTLAYWFRGFVSAFSGSIAAVYQYNYSSPALRLSPQRLWTLSLFLALCMVGLVYVHERLIGYPLPFTLQVTMPWWHAILALALWLLWKKTLREHPDALLDLQRYSWHTRVVVVMATVYPLLRYAFTVTDARHQLLITASLPILKLGFRNWTSHAVFRMEDVAPIIVTFSVDVFHALFLSCILQGANTNRTIVVTMVIDCLQSCVSVYEVRRVLWRANAVTEKIQKIEASAISPSSSIKPQQSNMLEAAIAILDANPDLTKRCPFIAHPRHLRPARIRTPSVWSRLQLARIAVSPTESRLESAGLARTASNCVAVTPAKPQQSGTDLSPLNYVRARFVRHVLKLLHMVEFYMLIEFTEVIVALIYATYLIAMFHLPNRVYYLQLKDMTDDQLAETIQNVLTYAGLELVSLALLGLVLSRLIGFSAFRVLTFALQKHWLVVHSQLTLWVYYVIQLSLEHFGNDYTFQFKWLHHR